MNEHDLANESGRRSIDVKPDPAFWQAIGGDAKVKEILKTFYDVVFADEVLAGFFAHTDKPTIRGKQFGFLKRCFTGDKNAYMGQRPRNAHHWMVISNEQFDHRQALMRKALVENGLSPEHVDKWMATEEVFRCQIVKDEPVPLYYRGVPTYWATEATEERLTVDGLCDRCHGEVAAGESLWVLGESAYCAPCRELASTRDAD